MPSIMINYHWIPGHSSRVVTNCDQACENRTNGHIIFDSFFKLSRLITLFATEVWLSTLFKQLMDYIIQVTEYKYAVTVLKNDLLNDNV